MVSSRRLSGPFLWLFIAVLLGAKALVPTGWMPVADAGGVRIQLCTAQGAIVATVDAEGRVHKDGQTPDTPRETCPFGILAGAADLPSLPAIADAPQPVAALQPELPVLVFAAWPHGPRPPTRGPPPLA